MTQTELTMIGLLVVIAAQTSYTTYRTWRTVEKPSSGDVVDVFVDTSVLMDGRIIPIAQAGFIPGRLVIPRSVIGELQLLADKGDSEKRERARRGLDVVSELQAMDTVAVELLQDGSSASEGVDERLLMHAKESGGMLCTIDFNLNKVAVVEGIRVLNVNELARGLRMSYLPGDQITLELTTTGTDGHQAVGHLDDGTMVVVEHAKSLIGQTVEATVIRSLQTAAGRMMFARLLQPAKTTKSPKARKPQQSDAQLRQQKKPLGRTGGRAPQPKEQVEPQVERPTKPTRKQPQSNAKANSRRPRTSAQREASFIDLVNQQETKQSDQA